MEDLTQAQKQQLGTWATQRDDIILSIAHKRDEEKFLIDSVNRLCQTKTEVSDEIQRSLGRLEELKKKEEEFKVLTTSENASLREQKSQLQAEVSDLKTDIENVKETRDSIVGDIAIFTGILEKFFDKVNDPEKLFGDIVKITSDNATEVKNLLVSAGAELKKIIDIGEVNVEKTNKVILDIPKMVVDLHRDVLERKIIARNRIGLIEHHNGK